MIEETRQVLQDFIAPELRTIDARLNAVESRISALEAELKKNHAELRAELHKNHEEVLAAISTKNQIHALELRLAVIEAEKKSAA